MCLPEAEGTGAVRVDDLDSEVSAASVVFPLILAERSGRRVTSMSMANRCESFCY